MTLTAKDTACIWHPYTQHASAGLPVTIIKGKGAYLYSEKNEEYLDAISSWWTNLHGHAHPYISKKIFEQANTLEHVIFAGFTHPKAIELADRLLKILPSNQKKIFYSDNGSTAVEVALKMAFQFWHNKGLKPVKTKVLALEGAYHGDTFGAMSVSARGIFTKAFFPFLFDVIHIPFPDKKNEKKALNHLKFQISNFKFQISSFIFEPLIQGASGMRTYRPEILNEMIALCKENNILTIADEVMTGFGRTGKMFATGYLSEMPDIICLSKGITGGFMPLGATSCTQEIYDAFLSPSQLVDTLKEEVKTFFHGHSYTANPLACAAACASLDLMEKKETWKKIKSIERCNRSFADEISFYKNITVRTLGTILAVELHTGEKTFYLNKMRDGIYRFFMSQKIIIRPLGNIIYIMPPYCISQRDLRKIYDAIKKFYLITDVFER